MAELSLLFCAKVLVVVGASSNALLRPNSNKIQTDKFVFASYLPHF